MLALCHTIWLKARSNQILGKERKFEKIAHKEISNVAKGQISLFSGLDMDDLD